LPLEESCGEAGEAFFLGEDVLQQEPEALRRFLFGKELVNRGEDMATGVVQGEAGHGLA
jgi:hypothetical protein